MWYRIEVQPFATLSMVEDFYRKVPKVELHAHLNGSITHDLMQELIHNSPNVAVLQQEFSQFVRESQSPSIDSFFSLFNFIYKLTDSPDQVSSLFF